VKTSARYTATATVKGDVDVRLNQAVNPSVPGTSWIVSAESAESPEAAVDAVRQFALALLREADS
jgi:hypothetical protein